MSTSHSSDRRDSTATEMTLTNSNTDFAGHVKSHGEKIEHFDDDLKTLSDLAPEETSSDHYKTKLSKAMAQLKSKLKVKEEKPTQEPKEKKQRGTLPPNYYPNNLQTFEALAASRM
ncbi:hypothetical protein GQX73_g4268 [Xylaria multiplex]|uniref:Uncharacterized protein n=1 Tax=Xylaria multiplex TaxID=323545 RepID=A0A7C8IPW7_9PEZI|nr:hypothetical protein GQX73_g4268 [Xylaria multiplex]